MKSTCKLIVLFIVLFSSEAKAQYYSGLDSVSVQNKNAVGLYISPAINFMMNSFAHNPRIGIQYKRIIANNKRLRLSAVMDKIQYGNPGQYTVERFVSATDSTYIIETEARSQQKANIRVGMEWSEFRKNIDSFFGIDFIGGYKKDVYDLAHITYRHGQENFGNTVHQYIYEDKNELQFAYTYEFIELGFAPVIGWRFDIKKSWELAVSASPEVTLSVPVASEWRGNLPVPRESLPDYEIEFRLRILEMVLSYRF